MLILRTIEPLNRFLKRRDFLVWRLRRPQILYVVLVVLRIDGTWRVVS
jgi:ABC-type cobalamin transport system permease subunit